MLFESLEVRNYPKKANKTKDNKQFIKSPYLFTRQLLWQHVVFILAVRNTSYCHNNGITHYKGELRLSK